MTTTHSLQISSQDWKHNILFQELKQELKQLETDLNQEISCSQQKYQDNEILFQELKNDLKKLETELQEQISRRLFW